ncbi:ankyrin [Russula aff. rugulosa BPL654]|nr:ankyrin [Russula aff. rugulosa BPL654]
MAEDRDKAAISVRLLEAARTDDVGMLEEVLDTEEYDINFQDGVSHGSLDVLDKLLGHEDGCDVDYTNRLEGATPLHLAVKIKEPELRAFITDCLLDAGADMSIKDKEGQVPLDYVPEEDTETRNAFRRYQVQSSTSKHDIAYDDEDFEDEEGEYSESDEE